jgi:glucosamine-6-phosphate deaminase
MTKTFQADAMTVRVFGTQTDLACDAAREVNDCLKQAVAAKGSAAAILATGNSQLKFLEELVKLDGVDWSKVTLFHMDEYLGLPKTHSASFAKYMRERVETLLHPKVFHYVNGEPLEPITECERYAALLKKQVIDLCCLGIGENGHIAFNDPPVADFQDPRLVKIVEMDVACRQQQVGEGHFPNLEAVPRYAITLTVPALCSAQRMLCIVPERRKAQAVKNTLTAPVSHACPATYLRSQKQAVLYLDSESASLI